MKIPVSHGHLEAVLREPDGEPVGAAVVCHPHPLHGGTMHTKAVFRAAQALSEAGLVALRFNFRGVGTSTGSYEEGIGEEEDVRAALEWLQERCSGLPLVLGGFSFGARVALSVGVDDERPAALLGLGLPVSLYDFSFLSRTDRPVLVVQGEEDEFGAEPEIREAVEALGSHVTLVTVPGADHFFNDRFDELKEAIGDFFRNGPGRRALALPEDGPGREVARAGA